MRIVLSLFTFILAIPAFSQEGPFYDGDWEIQVFVNRIENPNPADLPIRIRATVKCRRDKKGVASRIITLKKGELLVSKYLAYAYDPGTKMISFDFERKKRDPASGETKIKKLRKSFPIAKDCSQFQYIPGREAPPSDPTQNPFKSNNALPKPGDFGGNGDTEI